MPRRAPGRHRAPRTSVLASIRPLGSPALSLPSQNAMRATTVLLLSGGLAATGVVPAGADPAPTDPANTSSEASADWSQRGADEEAAQAQAADEPTSTPTPTEDVAEPESDSEGDPADAQDAVERTAQTVTSTKATRVLAPRAAKSKSVVNASRPMVAGVGALTHASNLRGIRYVWGGTTTRGFDCSGFTRYVYRKAGVHLPRTAAAQQRATRRVSNPRPGDLVFFGRPAHHVGIYAGNGKMYDSPRRGKRTGLHKIWSSKVTYGRV